MSSVSSIQPQDWSGYLWENIKHYANNTRKTIYSACPSLFDRMAAVYNFVSPKNAITGYREFWYLPTWIEIAIGNGLYDANCTAQGGKLDDEAMQQRVQTLVANISKHAQRPDHKFTYKATVIDSTTVNAWAMPGGKLAFFKGLIDKIDRFDLSKKYEGLTKDDVLAAVVGHEVSHAAIGHTRKRLEKTLLIQLALLTGKIAANVFIGRKEQEVTDKLKKREVHVTGSAEIKKYESYRKLVKVVFDYFAKWGSDLYMLMDSRQAEYEADKYGIHLMYEAGYDVRGSLALQELFMHLKGHSHKTSSWIGSALEWISTHPTSEKRFTANEKTVAMIFDKNGNTRKT